MIWFTIAMFVISFLASIYLAPKPELENARANKLSDIKFPIADEGAPVPVIFGKVRHRSPNCVWYGNFKTRALTKEVKTGIWSSENQITGYKYLVGFVLGLCTGPGVKLHKIWVEKKLLWQSGIGVGPAPAAVTINKNNVFGGSSRGGGFKGTARFYGGEDTQAVNAYLQDKLDDIDTTSYPGICYIVFERPYIGTSPNLRPLSFELSRYPDNLGLFVLGHQTIGDDLNPMEILYSLLTEEWGGVGMAIADIDTASFLAAAATLYDESNGMSLLVSNANDTKTIVEEVLRQVDGILYQDTSTGKIMMYLIRQDYVVEDLPVFDESNVVGVRDFTRNSWTETYNQVRVQFTYRDKKYENSAAIVQDIANINTQKKIRSTTMSFPGITNGTLAVQVASREASQLSVPLFKASLDLTRAAGNLHPGSPFLWSHADYGLADIVMRIQRFDLGELVNGRVVADVVQDKFAAANALFTDPESTLWDPVDRDPVAITEYTVMECPYWILNRVDLDILANSSYLWGLAARPTEDMQTYDFVTSDDNYVLDITVDIQQQEFPPSGRLVGNLWKEMGQSDGLLSKITIDSLDLDPNESIPFWEQKDPLVTTDANGIRLEGYNLMLFGGELIAFETYTDVGNGVWEFNNVRRALLDSQFEDHADNDVFYFMNAINWLSKNARADLDNIWYKYLCYSDQDGQELGDVTAEIFTTNQRYDRPLPPDLVMIDVPSGGGVRCPIEIIGVTGVDVTGWLERNRTSPDQVVLLGDSTDTPEVGTTYTVRVLLDGVQIDESTGNTIASVPISLTGLSGKGTGRVEIESVLATLASHTADFVEFWYAYYQSLTSDLVTNGDFELDPSTGWTEIDGYWNDEVTSYPLDPIPSGTKHGEARDQAGDNELRQDVDVFAYQGQTAIFRAWMGTMVAGVQSRVEIELIQSPSTVLDSISSVLVEPALGKWTMYELGIPISSSTNIVRITLHADDRGAAFDNVTLKANTVTVQTATKYDTVSGLTVVGAWGLRQLDSGHSGALIRIRDTYDDVETDIGQDEDGNLEMFHTRGEARVVRLYDQSGNGAHIEAESVVEQPRLHYGLSETGRPSIDFEGGAEALIDTVASTSRPYMATRPNCCFAIGPKETTGNDYIITIPHDDAGHTTPYYRWGMTTGTTDWRIGVNGSIGGVAGNGPSNGPQKNVWFLDYLNGEGYHNNDVISVVSWTPADITYPNNTRLRIGETSIGSLEWDGDFHELCIFTGTISAGDRQTIMEAVALYWYNLSV